MFSRLLRNALTIGILCLGIAGATAPSAGAAGQIESVLTTTSASQAGGHPNLTISAALANPGAPETAKSLVVEEPAGLSAYMYSVPRCSLEDLATMECSPDSQVGLATVRARKVADPSFLYGTAPIYAVAAGGGEYGRLAFTIPTLAFTQSMQLGFRSGGDDGLRLTIPNLPVAAPLRSLSLQLWGVPADPAHDEARFPLGSEGCPGLPDFSCNTEPTASGSPLTPLTGYPGSCGPTMPVGFRLETYQDPGVTTTASSTLTGATGCNLLSFDPALSVAAGSETRSTTGLDLDLTVPQEVSPAFPTPPPAKSVDVDFSGGLRLDPTCGRRPSDLHRRTGRDRRRGPRVVPGRSEGRVGEDRHPAGPGDARRAESAPGRGAERRAHPRQAPAEVTGSVYFGGLQPGGGHRLYLLGSGFGIDLKLVLTLDHRSRIRGADRQRQPAEVPDLEDRAPPLPERRPAADGRPLRRIPGAEHGQLLERLARPVRRDAAADHRLRARRDAVPRPGRAGARRALALAAAGRREIDDDGAGDRGRRGPGPGPGRGGRVQLERPQSPDRAGDRQRRRQLQRRADRLEHDRDADDHRDRDLGRPRNHRIGAPAPGLAELTGLAAARPRRWSRRSTRSRR